MLRSLWPLLLIFAVSASASVRSASPHVSQSVLPERERQVWKIPNRASEFSDVPHLSARSHCQATQPPQALTTPNPLMLPAAAGVKIKVSFIIGADGLRAVRIWRYRPATCNGVPTETEGKIEFSRR